jgi:hypothetical protein
MFAARTGAPVLPVSLIGTRTLLRGESRGRITASSRFASKNRYLQQEKTGRLHCNCVTVRAARSWRSCPTQPAEAAPVAANVYMLVQAMAERHEPEITKHEAAFFLAMPRCSPLPYTPCGCGPAPGGSQHRKAPFPGLNH